MMTDRWRSTRARLKQEAPAGEAPGLWSRIAASRGAGKAVELPARDPRQPMSRLIALAVVAAALVPVLIFLRNGEVRDRDAVVMSADDPEVTALLRWLPTQAHAQAVDASVLRPIDSPEVSRLTPRVLVYRHEEGVDGILTSSLGIDTISVIRDRTGAQERIVLIRNGGSGMIRTLEAIDSLVLGNDGSLLFWHFQVKQAGTDRITRVTTTLRPDSVRVTFWRNRGRPVREPQTWPGNIGEYVREPLIALLPSLPFGEGYARSFTGLDLLGGTTTPGFARPLELRVTGTQSISVPAGRFHCWTVELKAAYLPGDPPLVSRLWVDTQSGSLVRARWENKNGFFEEQTLIERHIPDGPTGRK